MVRYRNLTVFYTLIRELCLHLLLIVGNKTFSDFSKNIAIRIDMCYNVNKKRASAANRHPLDAADRRLARLNDYDKNSRLTFAEQGGYFCVLLLSLPIEYPIPKQVKPKLSTAISPKISMAQPSFPIKTTPQSGIYVIGGSQSLRRGLTAYHLGSIHRNAITQSAIFQPFFGIYV